MGFKIAETLIKNKPKSNLRKISETYKWNPAEESMNQISVL